MEKFTKGPWKLDKYGNIVQTNGRDARDCIRAGGLALTQNDGEPMYNKHLIAAAPEMYALLKELSGVVDNDDIKQILKKARGEK